MEPPVNRQLGFEVVPKLVEMGTILTNVRLVVN